ncbi:hypothetical protein PENTCL1PPCAC_3078 [Pristionchus entomophagus]|uniref:Uncharacterized protein n=1 Tax=Pristionchus entomophagus TaxID=358040 RepID=A0AAV5SFE4_9BILA|nr:hypothetical protein PENTCL1PPCAC_3078 [Pristionchus entomophagus]
MTIKNLSDQDQQDRAKYSDEAKKLKDALEKEKDQVATERKMLSVITSTTKERRGNKKNENTLTTLIK